MRLMKCVNFIPVYNYRELAPSIQDLVVKKEIEFHLYLEESSDCKSEEFEKVKAHASNLEARYDLKLLSALYLQARFMFIMERVQEKEYMANGDVFWVANYSSAEEYELKEVKDEEA